MAASEERPDGGVPAGMVRFGELEFTEAEATELSDASIAIRLVETGVSRLTAARIVEVGRGADAGRARPHKARR
jgi:hypothetical protein